MSEVIKDAEKFNIIFIPKESKIIEFDSSVRGEGIPINTIYGAMLTFVGKSKSFDWTCYKNMDGITFIDVKDEPEKIYMG